MTKNTEPHTIEAPEGVTALERTFKSKANRRQVTQRLYTVASGVQLGALRGGPLHMADGNTWEIFTLHEGHLYGKPVGFVTNEQLDRAVVRLSTWVQAAA